MTRKTAVLLTASLPIILLLGACASKTELRETRGELATVQEQIEAASRDSAEALKIANATQADLAAMKSSVEATRLDAEASRLLLEEMNSRMDRTFGTEGYK